MDASQAVAIRPISPGEFLAEDLTERGLSIPQFARMSGIAEWRLVGIIAASMPVTAEMAGKIAFVLGPSPAYWKKLEAAYQDDLRHPA